MFHPMIRVGEAIIQRFNNLNKYIYIQENYNSSLSRLSFVNHLSGKLSMLMANDQTGLSIIQVEHTKVQFGKELSISKQFKFAMLQRIFQITSVRDKLHSFTKNTVRISRFSTIRVVLLQYNKVISCENWGRFHLLGHVFEQSEQVRFKLSKFVRASKTHPQSHICYPIDNIIKGENKI